MKIDAEQRAQWVEVVLGALQAEAELFRRPLEGGYGRDVRATTRELVDAFAAALEGRPVDAEAVDAHRDYGRREVRLGRDLDGLLAGYGVAQRALWREVAASVPAGELAAVGEQVMAFFDGVAHAAAEGYAQERAARAGAQERRADALLGLLLRTPPPEAEVLSAAAERAGWSPPPEIRALVAARGDLLCALVPAGARVPAVGPAAVGPAVPWTEAGRSFARAVAGLALAADGGPPLPTDDHLLELWLAAAPDVADDLARRALAPLDGETPGARRKLADTLAAFLDHHGHQGAMAHALGLHQQTVRYRLGRLRDRFGPALDDPEQRLVLRLALRVAG